jgi:hypothetical protein
MMIMTLRMIIYLFNSIARGQLHSQHGYKTTRNFADENKHKNKRQES